MAWLVSYREAMDLNSEQLHEKTLTLRKCSSNYKNRMFNAGRA
jgi:hypothetical protein